MKSLIVLMVFFPLSLMQCAEEDFDKYSFNDNPTIESLNGTWKVISFENYTEQTVEFKNQENSWGNDIIIIFDDSKTPHELSGINTTNSIFGEFEYTGPRQFKLHHLSTTHVNQPSWANNFNQAILDEDVHFIISQNRLRIFYDQQAKSVTLTRI